RGVLRDGHGARPRQARSERARVDRGRRHRHLRLDLHGRRVPGHGGLGALDLAGGRASLSGREREAARQLPPRSGPRRRLHGSGGARGPRDVERRDRGERGHDPRALSPRSGSSLSSCARRRARSKAPRARRQERAQRAPVSSAQLRPKRARYFLSRSASFTLVFFVRDTAKSVRPASDRLRELLQIRITSRSCTRSKRSSSPTSKGTSSWSSSSPSSGRALPSGASPSSGSSPSSGWALPSGASLHDARRRRTSAATVSSSMRPPADRVAMRSTAAPKSLKLPGQLAPGDVAKARKSSRASALKVT